MTTNYANAITIEDLKNMMLTTVAKAVNTINPTDVEELLEELRDTCDLAFDLLWLTKPEAEEWHKFYNKQYNTLRRYYFGLTLKDHIADSITKFLKSSTRYTGVRVLSQEESHVDELAGGTIAISFEESIFLDYDAYCEGDMPGLVAMIENLEYDIEWYNDYEMHIFPKGVFN